MEEFRSRGGHPVYDENSVEYRFNSHGYRCPEFSEAAEIRMISIGCGFTMGDGLPQDALFHERFAEQLRRKTGKTTVNWNLAESFTGNDVVERVLHVAVPILDPHIVLILFPDIEWREYVSPQGVRLPNFTPAFVNPHPYVQEVADIFHASRQNGPAVRELVGKLAATVCQPDDELRFFRSYKSIEALLSGRCWLFGFATCDGIESLHVFQHLELERFAGSCGILDFARDCVHPGPYTHELLFQKFWNAFELVGTEDLIGSS
jgi:hypothetical protein